MEPLRATDPRQVGAYRLLGLLGAGGMGEVFLGESPGHRKVAVKLLRDEHAQDQQFRQRFAREVAAAKMVGGFHTAAVVDADPDGSPPWLATAYIPGPSLSAAVKQNGPLDPEAVRMLGASLAEGLAAIHACGLVHRDLKPANIILADDGPRIIDFGVARTSGAADLTSTGILVGTISYMSPEQVSGERVDSRSDVFSLGGVLAYAATGRSPFEAPTMPAIASRIVAGQADLDGVAGPLREVVEACLVRDPAARPTLDAITGHLTGTARQDTYVGPARNPTQNQNRAPDTMAPFAIGRAPGGSGGSSPRDNRAERIAAPAPSPVPPAPTAVRTAVAPPQLPPESMPPGRMPGGAPPKKPGGAAIAGAAVILAAAIGVAAYLLSSGGTGANHPGTSRGNTGAAGASQPAASGATVPLPDVGRWHGKLKSDTGLKGDQDAELTITNGSVGANVGQAVYPKAGCLYEFRLVSSSAESGRATLRATAVKGPCVSRYVVLTPSDGKELTENVYEILPADGGTPTSSGHLSRIGS